MDAVRRPHPWDACAAYLGALNVYARATEWRPLGDDHFHIRWRASPTRQFTDASDGVKQYPDERVEEPWEADYRFVAEALMPRANG